MKSTGTLDSFYAAEECYTLVNDVLQKCSNNSTILGKCNRKLVTIKIAMPLYEKKC